MTVRLRSPRPVETERDYTRRSDRLAPAARSCGDCRWPERCKADGLCWAAEKQAIREEREGPGRRVWTRDTVVEAIEAFARAHGGEPPTTDLWMRGTPDHPGHWTVKNLFGSWTAGLEAAGYTPRSTGWQTNRPKRRT